MLHVEGASLFRHHIVCSILSKKPVTITNIHREEDPPGIRPYEANFLKFIDRFTNGSTFQVSQGNTQLTFNPGMILGGVFSHEVPVSRCVTYVIEAALLLMPFAKYDSKITFVGCTQSEEDLSVDTVRTVSLRWLNLFGVSSALRVIRRGSAPAGNGAVDVTCTAVRKLKSIKVTERGRVKRIRGIASAIKVAPDLPQRTATAAKGVLLNILPDVYVVTDVDEGKGRRSELCSGYGVLLVAETTGSTAVISQETTARGREAPEDVGARCAHLLLDQILEGGCIDAHHQMLVLLLMALAPDEISVARLGRLTPSGISALVIMESFFGVTCAVKEEAQTDGPGLPRSTLVTCMGSNAINVWKKSS
jgi:RNA 3'-terminal phosphate cyclase-like protein